MNQIKLLDVVALLKSIPSEALNLPDEQYDLSTGLVTGTVGTVVEILAQQTQAPIYFAEFSDAEGRAYAFATVSAEDLLVLYYVPFEQAAAHS